MPHRRTNGLDVLGREPRLGRSSVYSSTCPLFTSSHDMASSIRCCSGEYEAHSEVDRLPPFRNAGRYEPGRWRDLGVPRPTVPFEWQSRHERSRTATSPLAAPTCA